MENQSNAELKLGIDVGAAEVKIALCGPDGVPIWRAHAPNRGRPLFSLLSLLKNLLAEHRDLAIRFAVTGSGQTIFEGLSEHRLVNEVVAVALAVKQRFPQARTIFDLGGQLSKWVLLAEAGDSASVLDLATNGLCAAGAGAFLEQQASRLGIPLDRLATMAAAAPRGASIAGRCSVFAKSDMIHLQQKGTPPEEIAYGLCQALVRTFASTVIQGRTVRPPVVVVGGGALNRGLVRALREHLSLGDDQLRVPEDALFLGAIGASLMASDAHPLRLKQLILMLEDRCTMLLRRDGPDRPLPPLIDVSGESDVQPSEDPPPIQGPVEAYLGVDVGSVSTNLALLSRDRRVLQGIYLPTLGRPLEAVHLGLSQIRQRFGNRIRILAVGATGSGRHLAAEALGADVTHNEITAQMVSSLHFSPEVDTIFEIGGQDSKYISICQGALADFEMNKICAGGTGSFLEEEAERLGIRIIGEFEQLALRAPHPCDLGSRCTVFMDTELVRAQERSATVEDLCAGLAYSIVRNYLEKVVGRRPIGRRIMFQGGTASNRAVVAAFRQLLGRPVCVHPYNRISGAIGTALLAARAAPFQSRFRGFDCCAKAELRSFECQRCENRCQVNRVRFDSRIVHFGDVCERYSEHDRDPHVTRRPFPELFAERDRLLESFLGPPSDEITPKPRIGLVRATLNLEFLPLWVAFLSELGYQPVVSDKTTPALLRQFGGGLPADICLPMKLAAAHTRSLLESNRVEKVFLPALLECPPREHDDDVSHTCFYVQQMPYMLPPELRERVITAQFALGKGMLGLLEPVLELAPAFHRSMDSVGRAFYKANDVQTRFLAARMRLGQDALDTQFDRAIVVLGRPYNTHDLFLNLSLARHLEKVGMLAIPWDLLPLEDVQLEERWASVPWYYSREQLRAIELIRRDPRLFPLLVSSYGCGADAFLVKHLEELLAGRPRLLLEFDEHRGEAGLLTRLEAFADEIEEHLRKSEHSTTARRLTPESHTPAAGRKFFIPNFSEHARIYAAVLESQGYRASVLPAPDELTLRLGEEHSSGRECHPYSVLAGELIRWAQSASRADEDVFLLPSCTTPCLIQQYGDAFRILLQRSRFANAEVWDAASPQLQELIGIRGLLRLYEGLLATDILFVLATRLRPYEKQPGRTDEVFGGVLLSFAKAIAQRNNLDAAFVEAAAELWSVPRTGQPADRPVIGVTGDVYTRMNPVGNAGLFSKLERMGCEVWPSPFFAAMTDLGATLEMPAFVERGQLKQAALKELTCTLTANSRHRLTHLLPDLVRELAVEPPVEQLIRLALPYVGPRTNHSILVCVAKMVDFLRQGAAGVISAAGINCVVGTAAAAVIPAIREDFPNAPILALSYGSHEGPAQRIRLDTFVQQAKNRFENQQLQQIPATSPQPVPHW